MPSGYKLADGIPPNLTWTPEADAALARLAGIGHSASEIGAELGKSRGSVIGRARRTGIKLGQARSISDQNRINASKGRRKNRQKQLAALGFTSGTVHCSTQPRTEPQPKQRRPKGSTVTSWAHGIGNKPEPLPKTVMAHDYEPKRVALIDLRFGECRRPLWDDLRQAGGDRLRYCGLPIERGSYCGACAKRMYVK